MSTVSVNSAVGGSPVLSRCELPAVLRVSRSQQNPDRRFYGCLRWTPEVPGCGFFRWIDPDPDPDVVAIERRFRRIDELVELAVAAIKEQTKWARIVLLVLVIWYIFW